MESRELASINQDLMMIFILGFIQVLLKILNADKVLGVSYLSIDPGLLCSITQNTGTLPETSRELPGDYTGTLLGTRRGQVGDLQWIYPGISRGLRHVGSAPKLNTATLHSTKPM